MKRDQKNIDKLFYDNLAGAKEAPPLFVWDKVEAELDKTIPAIAADQQKKRRLLAALFLFLAAGSAVWWAISGDTIKKDTLADTAAQHPVLQQVNGLSAHALRKAGAGEIGSLPVDENGMSGNAIPAFDKTDLKEEYTAVSENNNDVVVPANAVLRNGENTADLVSGNIHPNEFSPFQKQAVEETRLPHHSLTAPSSLLMDNKNVLASASNTAAKTVQVKKPGRFSITAFFAPDITTRNLEQAQVNSIDERKDEMVRTEKNGALDYTIGARLEYKLNKHFSLQSGISFSANVIDITQKTVYARYDRDGLLKFRYNMSSGYAYFRLKKVPPPQAAGDSAQSLSSSSTLHYVNIPLAVKYNLPSGRFNFSVQAGITARFITRQSIAAVYAFNGENEKSTTEQINGLKTSYFNGVVGIGAEYAINKRVAISVFPSFNFATTSINRDAPVKAYPNTLSLAAGVTFKL